LAGLVIKTTLGNREYLPDRGSKHASLNELMIWALTHQYVIDLSAPGVHAQPLIAA
jgi:hypothetical protein